MIWSLISGSLSELRRMFCFKMSAAGIYRSVTPDLFESSPTLNPKKTQQNFKFTDFFKLSKTVLYCIFSISSFLWGGRGSDGRAGIHIWRLVDRSLATLVCVSKYPWAWYIHQSVSANVRFKKKKHFKKCLHTDRKKEIRRRKKSTVWLCLRLGEWDL